jgi:hypothetical protein
MLLGSRHERADTSRAVVQLCLLLSKLKSARAPMF